MQLTVISAFIVTFSSYHLQSQDSLLLSLYATHLIQMFHMRVTCHAPNSTEKKSCIKELALKLKFKQSKKGKLY